MRTASLVFPFRKTFRQLELERRWWHRLCVVIFVVAMFGSTAFIAWVTYTVFAPQVTVMPDIQVGDIFDQVAATASTASAGTTTEWDANGNPIHSNSDPWAVVAVDGKPVQLMIDQQHTVHQIPMDKVIDALEAGDQRVVDMYDPKGSRGWIPEDKIREAIKAGFTIAKPVALDFNNAQPLNKSIQMPDRSTSTFAGTTSDDSIKAQWNHAKTHQTLIAIMWAALFAIVSALCINYLFQGFYRLLLYVIYGSKTQAA